MQFSCFTYLPFTVNGFKIFQLLHCLHKKSTSCFACFKGKHISGQILYSLFSIKKFNVKYIRNLNHVKKFAGNIFQVAP